MSLNQSIVSVYLIFVLKLINIFTLLYTTHTLFHYTMHLNNLVIIPIPALYAANNSQTEFLPLSPFKPHLKPPTINYKDDISWKKSFSAFKKFKPKRDKQAKPNIPLIFPTAAQQTQQPDSHQLLLQQKSFSLVNNEMDFSLLDNPDQSKITSQLQQYDKLNYYDPNAAPFFQYGVSYKYLQKENRVCRIEGEGVDMMEEGTWGQLKRTDCLKQRKQYTRKDNSNSNNNRSKSQSYFKITHHQDHLQEQRINPLEPLLDNALQKKANINPQPQQLKPQKPYCSQGLLPQYRQKHNNDDPFIIIKSTQRRQITSSNESINTARKDQMKSRQIKKTANRSNYNTNNQQSKPSSIYSRSVYSDRKQSSYSSSNSQDSHDYGNNQLQMIQFDLINHINPQLTQIKTQHNGLDNLHIFQLKDQTDKKKQLINQNNNCNNGIIREYEFVDEERVKLE